MNRTLSKIMKMASWMLKGRSIRMGHSFRSRHDSEDEYVQLDFSKHARENVHEIMWNVCRRQGVSKGKKVGYLNAFVKLLSKTDDETDLGLNTGEILCCLRVTLVHEAKEVRSAGLRATRYLLRGEYDVAILLKLQYSYLISRSLDIILENDSERMQAMRLVRKILLKAARFFPEGMARSLVSLANDGAKEKDRMLRASLAALSEICVLNPSVFISCGGVNAIMHNVLDCQIPRISEALSGTLLYLLNHPSTRHKAAIDLEMLAAPFTDFHYKHNARSGDKETDDREQRFNCSRMALLAILRSWPGILHFCKPGNSGLKSLVDVLYLRQLEVRKAILEFLYELLMLPLPEWTDECSVALDAVDPSHPQEAWKLSEGFVAAEGKSVLPHPATVRPNLIEIHLAVLVYIFVTCGLLEAIVEVIVTSDTFISVRGTILLGELLHLVHTLLPPDCCNVTPSLPNLLEYVASPDQNCQHRALTAVSILSRLHALNKRGPVPSSLFLDQILQFAGTWKGEKFIGKRISKSKLFKLITKEGDDMLHHAMKDSLVLTNRDPLGWDWNLIGGILKNRSDSFKKLEDSNSRTFIRRLVYFFKPSSNMFSHVEVGKEKAQLYPVIGCDLLDFLVEADEIEGGKALEELLSDISENLDKTYSRNVHDCLFSPHRMSSSLCQYYFLFVGRLSHHSRGILALEKAGVFQRLLDIVVNTNHDCYMKLIVSSLDYRVDGTCRSILTKALTAPSESSRLYATQFLRVLIRVKFPNFQHWGMELLVTQLYDKSKAVSLAAIDILNEACDYKVYLEAMVALRPSLLHLGDQGLLLLIRFLSLPSGFNFLQDQNFVSIELERWRKTFNFKYVRIVEGDAHDALTQYQRGVDGSYRQRSSSSRHVVKDVYVPPHLYGQLVQHQRGFELLMKEGKLEQLFQVIRIQQCNTEEEILHLKAAIWALGHIATSAAGVSVLSEEGLLNDVVHVAEYCSVYSVRVTALYALGLIGTTSPGANLLSRLGWLCVRHSRDDKWPVVEEESRAPMQEDEGDAEAYSGMDVNFRFRESHRRVSDLGAVDISRDENQRTNRTSHFYIPDDTDSESVRSIGDIREEVNDIMMELDDGYETRVSDHHHQYGDVDEPESDSRTFGRTQNAFRGKSHHRSLSESQSQAKTLPEWSRKDGQEPHHASQLRASKEVQARTPTRQRYHSLCLQPAEKEFEGKSKERSQSFTDDPNKADSDDKNASLRKETFNTSQESAKSCSSSLLESSLSGVSSTATGQRTTSDKMQILSPIASSSSLNIMKSSSHMGRNECTRNRANSLYGEKGAGSIGGLETASVGSSGGIDIQGYATLRSLHRLRRPLYSDSFADLRSRDFLDARALKVHSLDRHARVMLSDFEYPLTRVTSSLSTISTHSVKSKQETDKQCYMGISLPQSVERLFPNEDDATPVWGKPAQEGPRLLQVKEIQESEEAVADVMHRYSFDGLAGEGLELHEPLKCLGCCRMHVRVRKISSGSIRNRTDTESSAEKLWVGDEGSPIMSSHKNRSSYETMGTTPGSVSSNSSLDLIGSQKITEDSPLGKTLIRKEILKYVVNMSSSIDVKLSEQCLLFLKQKFPRAFHDVCLYSEISMYLSQYNFRLGVRRFIQELFLDAPFDELYEDAAVILQLPEVILHMNSTGSSSLVSSIGSMSASAPQSSPMNIPDAILESYDPSYVTACSISDLLPEAASCTSATPIITTSITTSSIATVTSSNSLPAALPVTAVCTSSPVPSVSLSPHCSLPSTAASQPAGKHDSASAADGGLQKRTLCQNESVVPENDLLSFDNALSKSSTSCSTGTTLVSTSNGQHYNNSISPVPMPSMPTRKDVVVTSTSDRTISNTVVAFSATTKSLSSQTSTLPSVVASNMCGAQNAPDTTSHSESPALVATSCQSTNLSSVNATRSNCASGVYVLNRDTKPLPVRCEASAKSDSSLGRASSVLWSSATTQSDGKEVTILDACVHLPEDASQAASQSYTSSCRCFLNSPVQPSGASSITCSTIDSNKHTRLESSVTTQNLVPVSPGLICDTVANRIVSSCDCSVASANESFCFTTRPLSSSSTVSVSAVPSPVITSVIQPSQKAKR